MATEWKHVPLFMRYHGDDLIENCTHLPRSLAIDSRTTETEYIKRADIIDEIVRLVNVPKLIEFLRTAGLSEEKITEIETNAKSHVQPKKANRIQ